MTRVVHVVQSAGFAGVERYICTTAGGLADRGWDVTVVGGLASAMSDALSPQVRYVAAADRTLAVALALARLGRTDVVHVHMTAAELAAVVARPRNRAPIVATRHFAARRGGGLAGRVGERSLAVEISISRFVADSIGRPSTILHDPVPRLPRSLGTAKVVLMAQRLEAEKETAVGLRAWAESGLAATGWQLRVAGAGRERASLERLAADLGVAGSVAFLGRISDMDLCRSEAKLFLATAPAEPFGLSVVEAMAAGLAVVAADGGAHRETLGDDPALLFPPGDVAAAALRLRQLSASPQKCTEMGEALRQRAVTLFSVDRHLDGLEAIYDSLMPYRREGRDPTLGGGGGPTGAPAYRHRHQPH